MVIHIEFDIKITDHNGIVLQSTKNYYDEDISSGLLQDKDTVPGIDFTDFLAEYLSSSGFILRERLMKGYSSGRPKRRVRGKPIKKVVKAIELDDEAMPDLLKASELEYKIRIGDNQIIVGRISLKPDADHAPKTESKVINASLTDEDTAIDEDTGNIKPSDNDEDTFREEASVSGNPSSICSFLNYSMMKAIEKYEDNIYGWYEDSTDMGPSTEE